MRVLLDKGADPQRRNDRGQDAVSLAREGGHDSLAELLEQKVNELRDRARELAELSSTS